MRASCFEIRIRLAVGDSNDDPGGLVAFIGDYLAALASDGDTVELVEVDTRPVQDDYDPPLSVTGKG